MCLRLLPVVLVLALAGLSFELIVFSKLACGLFTFISTAAREREVGDSSLILPRYSCRDKIVLLFYDLV